MEWSITREWAGGRAPLHPIEETLVPTSVAPEKKTDTQRGGDQVTDNIEYVVKTVIVCVTQVWRYPSLAMAFSIDPLARALSSKSESARSAF